MQLIKNATCFAPEGMLDSRTVEQFTSALELPYVKTGSLMADAHVGYALPIGAVIAAEDAIVPSWVGYDIGCGVLALRTGWYLREFKSEVQVAIMDEIYRTVPVGFNHNDTPVKWHIQSYLQHLCSSWLAEYVHKNPIRTQLGTLGSGNHFIEIAFDSTNHIWVVVHSGSRNFGHVVATHYMKLASGDGKAREGHYALEAGTLAFSNYYSDQLYVLQFAFENRLEIARRVFNAIASVLGEKPADWNGLINRNHNHVEYNKDLNAYIHRKGATHAEKDMWGVIPGNMRDGSVIVKGLGNPTSLFSSSHGAGRLMSREKARGSTTVELLQHDILGITARINEGVLDEGPHAYKNFQQVLELQKDLIEVVWKLNPLINVKGGK